MVGVGGFGGLTTEPEDMGQEPRHPCCRVRQAQTSHGVLVRVFAPPGRPPSCHVGWEF